MVYNMTATGNASSIVELVAGVNTASNGLFALFALVAIFVIILFRLLQTNPVPESFTAASAVATVLSLLFLWIGLVSIPYVIAFTVIWGASAIALYKSNSV